jgi:hypothetical protein
MNMKILTFRRLIGLAAIGGFAYVHKQRGGEWTMASIKDTMRHLWSSASTKTGEIREAARDSSRSRMPDDRNSRPYTSYDLRDDDRNRH